MHQYKGNQGPKLGVLGLMVKVLDSVGRVHSSKNSKGSIISTGSIAMWLSIAGRSRAMHHR